MRIRKSLISSAKMITKSGPGSQYETRQVAYMDSIPLLCATGSFKLNGRRTARHVSRGLGNVIQLLKEAVLWVDESNVSELHFTRLV
jgi:hypothetical protein